MVADLIKSWFARNDYLRGIRKLNKSGVQVQIVHKVTDNDAFVAIPFMSGGQSNK